MMDLSARGANFRRQLFHDVEELILQRISGIRFSVGAQKDGVGITSQHTVLNFNGPGVNVSDDPANRRTNVFIPGTPSATASTVVIASDATAKVKVIVAGTDPDATYPGWHTVGFDDSAWGTAVVVTPNAADVGLIPTGCSAIWSKAFGAPYQVSGAQIGSDFSIPVTSPTGGLTGWTVSAGAIYAIETIGGPWNASGSTQPHYNFVQVSTDGGTTWHDIDLSSSTASVENSSDANHFRGYITAIGTTVRARVLDSIYGDNAGSISVRLYPAQAIEVLVRKTVALSSSLIASAFIATVFDSAGSVWINDVAEGVDATGSVVGPPINSSIAPGVLTPSVNNTVAAWVKGVGGSAPDRGWVAFALSTSVNVSALDPRYQFAVESATAPALTTGGTIATSGVSEARVAPAGAVTGVILAAGTAAQEVIVVNQSANTITFAVAGTSHVADGAGSAIAGLTARKFVYNNATSLWYRTA